MATVNLNVRAVARELSLSTGTVSRAIRGLHGQVALETAKRVLDHCVNKGLVAESEAQRILYNLKSGDVKEQIFVVTAWDKMPFYQDVKIGVCDFLQSIGAYACSYSVDNLDSINNFPCEKAGVVIVMGIVSEKLVQEFTSRKIKVVLVDDKVLAPGVSSVNSDNISSVQRSIQILSGQGHKRIAFVCLHQDIPAYTYSFHQRQFGYEAGVEMFGCDTDRNLLVINKWTLDPSLPVWRTEHFNMMLKTANMVLDLKPMPTAVIAANDCMAYIIRRQAMERGILIPEDLSIIGYDGAHLVGENHLYERPISTNVVKWRKMGQEAAKLAIELINAGDNKSIEVMTYFEDNGTVAKVKKR